MNTPLDETCLICGRVHFGEIVRTGFGHWRHEACGLGGPEWREFFMRLSSTQKKALQEFFDFSYSGEEKQP